MSRVQLSRKNTLDVLPMFALYTCVLIIKPSGDRPEIYLKVYTNVMTGDGSLCCHGINNHDIDCKE